MNKFKSNDMVIVTTGKDKGKTGKILKIVGDRLLVESVNVVKKHMRKSQSHQGGIVEKEAPIHHSNVMHLNSVTNKADRVGIKTLEDGRKVRFYKSNQELVDV